MPKSSCNDHGSEFLNGKFESNLLRREYDGIPDGIHSNAIGVHVLGTLLP